MATITVRRVKDVANVTFGDQLLIEPEGFDSPDHDPNAFADAHRKLAEAVQNALDGLMAPSVTVEFTDTHVVLLANADMTVEISGDVRDDRCVELTAGQKKQRKLTGEGHGFVQVNSERFNTPNVDIDDGRG